MEAELLLVTTGETPWTTLKQYARQEKMTLLEAATSKGPEAAVPKAFPYQER